MTLEQAGVSGRLGELYLEHAPATARFAYLMTGDRALAEDLVQDAFARVIGRLGHLREASAFPAYLRRAVVNLAKNHYRRRSIEQAYLEREGARPSQHITGPDLAAADAMRRALLALPERQRAAIALRFYEDLSEEQIAAALECRPGTVRSLVSRGMATLREQLGGDDDA